jgi:hypothetical protein
MNEKNEVPIIYDWDSIRGFAEGKDKFSCEELYNFLSLKEEKWEDECQVRKKINDWIVSNLGFVRKDIRKDDKIVKGYMRIGTGRTYQKIQEEPNIEEEYPDYDEVKLKVPKPKDGYVYIASNPSYKEGIYELPLLKSRSFSGHRPNLLNLKER